jgi:hypothetical protein
MRVDALRLGPSDLEVTLLAPAGVWRRDVDKIFHNKQIKVLNRDARSKLKHREVLMKCAIPTRTA